MYKNQLQELAQRSCFNLPSYACIREGPDHAPRFKATVNFNGETFESPAFCTTLRQAEHSAAEVALEALSKRGPSRSLAARVLDETGVYKNLLQETAHRAGLNLPNYTTVRSGPGHVPVFHCTVEIAGLSFTGEPAKTKKQAQKNAAMAAWSVLKQLPHMQTSSSSSIKPENERKDEQEQIVVARALAKLCPSDVKRSTLQTERQHGRQRSAPVRQDMKAASSAMHLYPMQYPSWSYPHYSPEMAMFRMWQPEQVFQQQSCLLTLPMSPSPPGPQILPIVHSVFQPDRGQYILARDKEPVSVMTGIPMSGSGPSHLLSDHAVPINTRSISQVTIKEIQEERSQETEDWLNRDANSDGRKVVEELNASVFPQLEVQNSPGASKTNAETIPQDKPHEDHNHGRSETNTGNSVQLERNQSERSKWSSQSLMETTKSVEATDPVKFHISGSVGFDSSQANLTHHPAKPSSIGVAKYSPHPSNAAPVRIRTVGQVSPVKSRPEGVRSWVPASGASRPEALALGCSSRPRLMQTGGRIPTRNFMAPAVQIRSVIPVCSAPPAKMADSNQGRLHSTSDRSKQPEDVAAANSELSNLRI